MSRFRIPLLILAVLVAAGGGWGWRFYVSSKSVVDGPQQANLQQLAGNDAPMVEAGPIRFSQLGPETGIAFIHTSGNSPERPFPAANGSGVAALDYDLDGNYDLFFLTGTPFPIEPDRKSPINRFYRNTGDWNFQDVTAECGLDYNGYSTGVAVGDYDADGFPDVFVTCFGENLLYHNLGDGTFAKSGKKSGVADRRWATSAAFLDFDYDGLLDLYVCNYGKWSLESNGYCGDRTRGVRLFCSPRLIEPQHDIMYQNQGEGTFRDVTEEVGLAKADRAARAQGVIAADLNQDGRIDLYIGNDLNANSLYFNEPNSQFRDATESSGVAYNNLGSPQAGMGVDAADVNQTGRMDLFVTNFEREYNAFYDNTGDGLFAEVSHARGLGSASLPWVGWGTAFADFDLDGWIDLIVTNGHVDDNLHEMGREALYKEPPLVWQNVEGHFTLLGASAGPYFAEIHPGRGLAIADLDNDGDSDVVIVHQDALPALLRNDARTPDSGESRSISLRLVGTRSNRDAVGSLITFTAGSRTVVQQIKGGGSYLSAHDLRQVFAVVGDETPIRVEIQWPDGGRSVVSGLEPDESYLVIEPADPLRPASVVRQHRN